MSHALTASHLKLMLRQVKISNKTICVFLSAEYSSIIGKIFADAGATHVVCANGPVSEEIQQEFTEQFYENLI